MSDTNAYSSDVAFTPTVKAIQARKGSREAYAHVEQNGGWRTEIDDKLAGFLANTNSFYLATATKDGQPYIQHRGSPKGFIKILDKTTIAFADFAGNQQYITQGNLTENPQAQIFIMDYAHRQRVNQSAASRGVRLSSSRSTMRLAWRIRAIGIAPISGRSAAMNPASLAWRGDTRITAS